MRGRRFLVGAIVVFGAGLAAVIVAINEYRDAYAWVAHTSDVRLVIGRTVGHAGQNPSCEGLRRDAGELDTLTGDNPLQHARMPRLRTSVELLCAGAPAPALIDELSAIDATERRLLSERRVRLTRTRWWALLAFGVSTLGAIAAVAIASLLQRRAGRALAQSEERFRMLATSSLDLVRIHEVDGKPTYCSPSVERILGYTPEEMLALSALTLGHPDDLPKMRQTLVDIQREGVQSTVLVYRLKAKDGRYRWVETHTNPVRDERGTLLRFYTVARDVTERVELEHKLEHAAVTDELTGLLNRRGFLMIAGQEHRVAIRQHHGIAVIFADLDGLKTINDQLGHEHGDAAIRQLAEILRTTLRDSDVIARLGGDEFAALAYNVDGPKLESVLARVRAAVAAAPPTGPYALAVSLGVALLPPGESRPLEELLAEADQRMYDNKRARKASSGHKPPEAPATWSKGP